MTIKHIARNSILHAPWQGMAWEPILMSLSGHRHKKLTTALLDLCERKNQNQRARQLEIKMLSRILLGALLLATSLNTYAQGTGNEDPSNGYSYEHLFAGKQFYWENPRTGSQFELTFCSSGNYTEFYQGMFSTGSASDETHGIWQVYEDGGQVYLDKKSGDKVETRVVTQGSRVGLLRLDKQEYTVSNSNQCN